MPEMHIFFPFTNWPDLLAHMKLGNLAGGKSPIQIDGLFNALENEMEMHMYLIHISRDIKRGSILCQGDRSRYHLDSLAPREKGMLRSGPPETHFYVETLLRDP